MIKRTKKNVERLAKEAVSQLDMDSLIEYAEEQLAVYYGMLPADELTTEWVQVFGEE